MTFSFSKSFQSWWYSFQGLIAGLSVMDRYIATELIPPFLFGVGAFSSIGVAIGSLFDLIRKMTELGLPLEMAVQVLLLKLPEFVVYAFPMSTLLATLMTYSRLSSDSELIALRGCGISLYRLVVPAVVLSFLVTGTTFLFNEVVVPRANYLAANTLEQALSNREKVSFQEKNIYYQEFTPGTDQIARLFYAKEFDGKKMKGLTILDFSQGGLDQIVTSESANWNFAKNTWDFYNGTIYVVATNGSYRNILKFEHQELKLPRAPLDLATKGRDYTQMNIAESEAYLDLLRQGGDEQKIRKLTVAIQQKYSLPFICVVFGLVGSVLGSKPQRTNRATSFGLSVLIIFSYYLLSFVFGALGQTGILSPFVAAWAPNLFGLAAGGFLLVRASR